MGEVRKSNGDCSDPSVTWRDKCEAHHSVLLISTITREEAQVRPWKMGRTYLGEKALKVAWALVIVFEKADRKLTHLTTISKSGLWWRNLLLPG